ncbi:nonspecific acid phosphatase [Citreicella sp. SE45]|uniref:Haloacid dehalogenase-like hydrolase n=1 Tax=Salipiger thiooxidans TaxID=282683 RepID=A0A1G7A976_9RHOB|nr:haloacid dehalogenase-like hydrolase [Salipiger thiooxidans]EEX16092.1 nonspecific acid phosphatase [Citreicella sp. SE45]NVK58730.1 haloacid dehalogenase-like hydrolase [Paracoccaceae bacterium]SDE11498.1 haloacid dehalogenase-like hydrolase [Salipiger thiooxidans]
MRIAAATIVTLTLPLSALADPLPSWNDTEAKAAIIAFVDTVTDPESGDFVPARDRIATFDNDGTLWAEQPVYFQALYALDVLREKAADDPSILGTDVLKAAAEGDLDTVMASGIEGLLEVINVSHAGITVDAFQADAYEWLTTATHPTSGKTYAGMVYQPMLELLSYLRDEGFATYIVSGGGIDFIRSFADDAYGIPPWQVVGTEGTTTFAVEEGGAVLNKDGGVTFVDDKEGKPVGIIRHIGQRPIFAAGNSDGDFEMLEYTTGGDGPSFGLIVHHTDAEREFSYDRDSHIGELERGLDEGPERGWLIVDMAQDWAKVFPSD